MDDDLLGSDVKAMRALTRRWERVTGDGLEEERCEEENEKGVRSGHIWKMILEMNELK